MLDIFDKCLYKVNIYEHYGYEPGEYVYSEEISGTVYHPGIEARDVCVDSKYFTSEYELIEWMKANTRKQYDIKEIRYVGDFGGLTDVIQIDNCYYCQINKTICLFTADDNNGWKETDNYTLESIFKLFEKKGLVLKNNVFTTGLERSGADAIISFLNRNDNYFKRNNTLNTQYATTFPGTIQLCQYLDISDDISVQLKYIGNFRGLSDVIMLEYPHDFGTEVVIMRKYISAVSNNIIFTYGENIYSDGKTYYSPCWYKHDKDVKRFEYTIEDLYAMLEEKGCKFENNVFKTKTSKPYLYETVVDRLAAYHVNYDRRLFNLTLRGYRGPKLYKKL